MIVKTINFPSKMRKGECVPYRKNESFVTIHGAHLNFKFFKGSVHRFEKIIFVETPTLKRSYPKYVFHILDFGGSVVYLISVHIK